ncbi:MAG: hypothetical protein GY870_08935 [archaeon]|nr:hypothetical protein [archaeon]
MINQIFQGSYNLTAEIEYIHYWDAIAMGLFFVIIGIQILLFIYFFFLRFRKTSKLYWLYFSLFFLFIAISRILFVSYDYLMPWIGSAILSDPLYPFSVYRWASFFAWLAVSCLVGILTTLLFTKEDDKLQEYLKIIFPLVVVILGSLYLFLPPELLLDTNYYIYASDGYGIDTGVTIVPGPSLFSSTGVVHVILSYAVLPLLSFGLPLIFLYLALKSIGVIRKSSALNGIGFFLYFLGKITQTILKLFAGGAIMINEIAEASKPLAFAISVVPAIFIIISLFTLAIANLMLQS